MTSCKYCGYPQGFLKDHASFCPEVDRLALVDAGIMLGILVGVFVISFGGTIICRSIGRLLFF